MSAIDTSSGRMYQQQGVWCAHTNRQGLAKKWQHNAGVISADALIALGKVADQSDAAHAIESRAAVSSRSRGMEFNASDFSALEANEVADKGLQKVTLGDTRTARSLELRDSVSSVSANSSMPAAEDDVYVEPPNLLRLTSALTVLEPDCSEFVWKFHRLAPMANAAREFPEIADRLYQMAKDWSSGKLRGVPSKKWSTPGSNGFSGRQLFDREWKRFLSGRYTGKRATLGTIYWHAQQAGWSFPSYQPEHADDAEVM